MSSPTRIIVIGSGIYGLAFSETYLKLDPTASLTILESDPHLGGTWSQDRVYPTLLAQQPGGAYEIPGHTLTSLTNTKPDLGTHANFIPGTLLSQYLTAFAKKVGLYDRIVFNSKVVRIEKVGTVEDPKGWRLYLKDGKADGAPDYVCDRLVLAVGTTNEETIPDVPHSERFTGPIIHSKYFGREIPILADPFIQTVTVYGGGKSALDAIHVLVKEGKKINWVVRPDETSPGLPYYGTGVILGNNTNSLITTRTTMMCIPNLDDTQSGAYSFFHSGKSRIGAWLFRWYWAVSGKLVMSEMGYDRSENGRKLMPQIKPEDGLAFWTHNAPAILTNPEVVEWIHSGENITVHRAEITEFTSPNTLTITSPTSPTPTTLTSHAVVYCTGYKATTSTLLTPALSYTLGLPTPLTSLPPQEATTWTPLVSAAHEKISRCFPYLAHPPAEARPTEPTHTPYRLYRHLIPVDYLEHQDRTFASLGTVQALSTGIMVGVSGLWASAWLTGKYDPLEGKRGTRSEVDVAMQRVRADVAERSVWPSRRYLSFGVKMDAWLHELFYIVDKLLTDLAIKTRRKSNVLTHCFAVHGPEDYATIAEEFLANIAAKEEASKGI